MNYLTVTIGTVGGLALIAGIVLLIVLNSLRKRDYDAEYSNRRWNNDQPVPKFRPVKWPGVLIALGLVAITAANSFTIVPTGYTGVRTTFGLIDQDSCMPGFNPLAPFVQRISLVNNKQQDIRIEDRIWSETKEQTVVYMENTVVTYRIVPKSSAWIYANVDNWVQELIDSEIVSSAAKTASRQLGAEVVTDRGTIEPLAVETLQAAVDSKYGPERVEIKNVIFGNIDFEESYNQAIAEKSNAIQEQQKQAILNQTNIDKVKAEAEAERQRAQGEADAELIRAQGKADAAKEIAGAITEATQRQDAIDKWDGRLPQYVSGDDASFGVLATTGTQGADTGATP